MIRGTTVARRRDRRLPEADPAVVAGNPRVGEHAETAHPRVRRRCARARSTFWNTPPLSATVDRPVPGRGAASQTSDDRSRQPVVEARRHEPGADARAQVLDHRPHEIGPPDTDGHRIGPRRRVGAALRRGRPAARARPRPGPRSGSRRARRGSPRPRRTVGRRSTSAGRRVRDPGQLEHALPVLADGAGRPPARAGMAPP